MPYRHRLSQALLALSLGLASSVPAATPSAGTRVVYQSTTGQTLTAVYEPELGRVKVHWPQGQVVSMKQARSGSGSRYTAGAMEFWEHQGEATLRKRDKLLFQGKAL